MSPAITASHAARGAMASIKGASGRSVTGPVTSFEVPMREAG